MSAVMPWSKTVEPQGRDGAPPAIAQAAAPSAASASRGMPARYELVVAACLLLTFATSASLPFGPSWDAPWRGILTVLAAALTLALLLVASANTPRADCLRLPQRLRRVLLAGAIFFACCSVLAFVGWGALQANAPSTQAYWSDVVSFTDTNARLVLAGHNPYTSNATFAAVMGRFPHVVESPLRRGAFGTGTVYPSMSAVDAVRREYAVSPQATHGAFDPDTLHSYPALSFLLFVPALWAGASSILLVSMAVYLALLAWLIWLAPAGWHGWTALAALTAVSIASGDLFLEDDVICVAFLLAAWHLRNRRWPSAILLGLGCAFKQYCWIFVPFFAIDIIRRHGWREAGTRAPIALAAFLLPNLPYIIFSPHAWFTSLWVPMSDPFFPMGLGFIVLFNTHVLPWGQPQLYTALEGIVMLATMAAYWRWWRVLEPCALLLPVLPLFFAYRSLPDYFAFTPWLALYSVNCHYARQCGEVASSLAEALRTVAGAVTQKAGIAAYALRPPVLALSPAAPALLPFEAARGGGENDHSPEDQQQDTPAVNALRGESAAQRIAQGGGWQEIGNPGDDRRQMVGGQDDAADGQEEDIEAVRSRQRRRRPQRTRHQHAETGESRSA